MTIAVDLGRKATKQTNKTSLFLCLVFHAFASVHCCLYADGKELTSWHLLLVFIVFLLLSHVVTWVRCGT